jgi:hypothetical protein
MIYRGTDLQGSEKRDLCPLFVVIFVVEVEKRFILRVLLGIFCELRIRSVIHLNFIKILSVLFFL